MMADGHRGEDRLEAFCNICEDAAAVDGDSRRQVQRRNLLVHQDAHRLRVFRDDIRNDACRPTSVRAADGHRPFPQNSIGQITQESRPARSNNYERPKLVDATGSSGVAGEYNVHGFPIYVDGSHPLADCVLADLKPDLQCGQTNAAPPSPGPPL